MTTQERINELANKALRSGPPPAATPKPLTFMPSFEKLKTAEFITTPVTTTATIPAAAAAPVPAPAPAAEVSVATADVSAAPAAEVAPDHQSDPDLKEMLDSRDGRRAKRQKRDNRLVTFTGMILLATAGTWLTVSPVARAKMHSLATAVKQSGKDVKALGGIMGTYEEQLDKVAVQGARIDAASLALGVDPNAETSAQDASISTGMNKLTGEGGGPTVMERDANLQKKFGIVGKLAKDIAPKTEKAKSDMEF